MPPRHDISSLYFLKSTIEDLFGRKAWYEIKECTSITIWKKYCVKILCAISVAADSNVIVVDNAWHKELNGEINRGKEYISIAKEIDEVIAVLAATLTRVSFLQFGFIPQRKTMEKVTLHKQYWQLDKIRSVQYVQNDRQKCITA